MSVAMRRVHLLMSLLGASALVAACAATPPAPASPGQEPARAASPGSSLAAPAQPSAAGAPPSPSAEPVTSGPVPPGGWLVAVRGGDVARGEALWGQQGCDGCHSPSDRATRKEVGWPRNALDSEDLVARAVSSVRGGVGKNKRLTMPAHPHLVDAQLVDLLRFAQSRDERGRPRP